MKKENKKELVKMNALLIQRLSIIPFCNIKGAKLNVDFDFIQENLVKSLKENVDDLFLELDWSKRDKIIALLIKNYNFTILYDECISNELKKDLLKENNNLVVLLLALEVKPVDKMVLVCNAGKIL